jgi:type IV secretory pathway TraG/TraD family ATPase VirD4
VVLFSLNSSTYGRLSAQLGTLAVQDLVGAAGHRLASGPAPPAVVGIDEFSALGSDNVVALLARGREAGVSVLLATQELADLDRSARGLRDQVLGNTAVKIAHRQDVPASAETVAHLAGTVPDWERSYSVRPGRWGGSDLRQGTLKPVERFVVDPNRVRSLRTGEAVVIVKTPRASAHVARVLPARSDRGMER